jgi:hypothetical protein
MPDIAPLSGKTPRRGSRAINLEEWASIMTRLYRIIEKELSSIETRQNKAGKHGESELSDSDTRRLVNAVRAVERVHFVNKDVEEGENAERIKQALRETEAARKELDRRLARIFGEDEA